ncbi:hypothetical protein ACFY9N_16645 [Microbacterium sp. NPDC008134]|uniref:hypothetical protein n=1 Tax=Microbacterium sp. NPDC008134 TaxID=3364183 RepID=UPI0036E5DF42
MTTDARVTAILDELPGLVDAGLHDGRRWFARWHEGAVRLLDDRLSEVSGRALALTGDVRVRAASAVGRLVLSAGSDAVLVGEDTVTIPGLAIDSAAFIGDLVLATAPAPGDGGGHRVLLLDLATGTLLDEKTVDADDAIAAIHPHPHDPVAVIEFAMGQDGCLALRADIDATGETSPNLRLTEILAGQDPVIAGFRPAGDRLLVTPYPSDPETARVFAWPSLEEIGQVSATEIGAEYGLGIAGCWVDDERAAIFAPEDALVLTGAALDSPERADLPDVIGEEAGEVESLVALAPGRIAAGVWTPEGRSTLVIECGASAR